MRILAIVVVLLVSNACAPNMAISTTGGADNVQSCGLFDECFGGTGDMDGMVSFAVGSTIVGTLAFVLARHLRAPSSRAAKSSRAASRTAVPAPASSLP